MKKANISELRNNLSRFLAYVLEGGTLIIQSRNIPVAQITPLPRLTSVNKTVLGCGKGTGKILEDPTQPFIPEDNWEMHK